MKKFFLVVLMSIVGCSLLSSCDMVERFYPLLDYEAIAKNSQDIYARNDAYAQGDTMCLDRLLVKTFEEKKNISSRYQYTLAKPKVEWQRRHLDWMMSKDGKHMRWVLFYLMVGISIVGLLLPLVYVKLREKMEDRQRGRLEKKAENAILKGDYDKADAVYDKLEKMQPVARKFSKLSHWSNRSIPYLLFALTLLEGLYLFLFNFNMPMLSPTRVGGWNALINITLLAFVMFLQMFAMWIYSDMLSWQNDSESRWWMLPIKWILAIAVLVVILKNTFVMPLEIVSLVIGAVCMVYVLKHNRIEPLVDVKVYGVTLFLMSYIFMYFLSYALLIILTIIMIIIGLMFGLKMVNASVEFGNDQNHINEMMQKNPTMTYEQASHRYYEEKRAEIKKAMEAEKINYNR